MQTEIPQHRSGKPEQSDEPKRIRLGEHLTLLDKTLAFYVSQRGGNCFWGRVLNGCSIQVQVGWGTAGVCLTNGGKTHAFIYDPLYFQDLSKANRRCTLVHEAVHVTCLHLIRYMRLMSKEPNKKVRKAIAAVFNIAADMETNDTYVRLEKDFKKTLNEGEFWHLPEQHDLPAKQSMETYIELLLRKLPQVVQKLRAMAQERKEPGEKKDGEGGGGGAQTGYAPPSRDRRQDDERSDDEKASETAQSVAEAADKFEKEINELLGLHEELTSDNHSAWMQYIMDLAEKDPSKLEQLIEQAQKEVGQVIKTAHDTTVKLRGTVPGGVSQRLQTLMQEPVVPWTDLMRDWILDNLGRDFTDTMRMPSLPLINLDTIEPFPGAVPEPEVSITWITDTSGSMSDDAFAQASSEMAHLIGQTKAIRVHHIQIDTVIQSETVHDNSDPNILAQERRGYGGTTLAAAFARAVNIDIGLWREGVEKIDEVRPPDMMVVFTDGYIEPMAEVMHQYHPGCPTLWLITPCGRPPQDIVQLGAPHRIIQIPRR